MVNGLRVVVGAKFKPRCSRESSALVNVMEDKLNIITVSEFCLDVECLDLPLSCLFLVFSFVGAGSGSSP